MTPRIVWPITALLGLVILIVGISNVPAQRPQVREGFGHGPQPHGRFVVAHASAGQVLILDSATGKVYRARQNDFLPMSELPRPGGFMPMPFPQEKAKDSGVDKDRPRDQFKDKDKAEKEK
jgi:hypothetical protein